MWKILVIASTPSQNGVAIQLIEFSSKDSAEVAHDNIKRTSSFTFSVTVTKLF